MDVLEILVLTLGLAVGIAALAFWIWMLIDCLRHESRHGNDRIVWLVVLVATQLLGAVLYYFMRHRPRLEAG